MELMQLQPVRTHIVEHQNDMQVYTPAVEPRHEVAIPLPFIEANTKKVELEHLRKDCVVPVFSKDNEVTISHTDFIESINEAANIVFSQESILPPEIRVSHIVKGRVPEAIHKPINQLTEDDKTIYYERMMFCIEIPTIHEDVAGNRLNLTIGGVRAYNHENLYSKKSLEKFKVFIGFKNMVCCNLCVATDGYKEELKIMTIKDLLSSAVALFQSYNADKHLHYMRALQNSYLSELQFAQFIGKSRLYQFLPAKEKKLLPPLLMIDTQIGLVAKNYYKDEAFSIGKDSEISIWKVYNLLTGANKTSYIDNFLDRSLNITQLAEGLNQALSGNSNYSWFIE